MTTADNMLADGDPRDTFSAPGSDEPDAVDHAIQDLQNAISVLEGSSAVTGYDNELDLSIARLSRVYETAKKPF